ncbi:hypothetical protein JW960_00525 [candidate division KSB1 bacterium]|nr:hypothetical protein [candidate division KSB1 bacterium]
MYRLGYTVESSQLQVLITDLESSKAHEAIQAIGAEQWLADMKETQQLFEVLYQQKVDAESVEDYPLLVEKRKQVKRM